MRTFDLAIIGGGAAGVSAAVTADGLGASTVLVEQSTIGGEELNFSCVPASVLRYGYDQGAAGPEDLFNIGRSADYKTVMARARQVAETIRLQDYEWPLARLNNLIRIRGKARFAGPHKIAVGTEVIRARRILIAAGSVPRKPAIEGLADIDCLVQRDIFDLTRPPTSLGIIGADPRGLELAQIIAGFGAKVIVIHRGTNVLPDWEPEIGGMLMDCLRVNDVDLAVGKTPRKISWRGPMKEIVCVGKHLKEIKYICEDIFVAAGRKPATVDLGLEEIGLETADNGSIPIDDDLATSMRHIFAAGSVCNEEISASGAKKEGAMAAINALDGGRRQYDFSALPRRVNTYPPVSEVGVTEKEAVGRGHEVKTVSCDYEKLPAAIINGDTRGMIKMVADKRTRRVLGCSAIGVNAGEIINEVALAIKGNLTADDLTACEHAGPTYSQIIGMAASGLAGKPTGARRLREIRERAA